MDNQKLRAIGWKRFFEQQVSSEVLETSEFCEGRDLEYSEIGMTNLLQV